ncbi:MAG: hypothetical protein BAA02_13480 [Paenibacillaceae bacterium ZCTH02-B3]|nr:MAG: hypothetical protein BAA02_13480 [Paenibacillaceae bacterium ZCTH02-B3]
MTDNLDAKKSRGTAELKTGMKRVKPVLSRMWKFKDMRILFKLYSGFGAILIITLLVSLFSLFSMNQIGGKTKELYEERLTNVSDILTLAVKFQEFNSNIGNILLNTAGAQELSTEDLRQALDEIRGLLDKSTGKMKDMGIQESQITTFNILWDNYLKDFENFSSMLERGDEKVGNVTGFEAAKTIYTVNISTKTVTMNNYLSQWVDINKELAEAAYRSALNQQTSQIMLQIILILAAVALTVLVGWAVARSIINPLSLVVQAAGEMSKGRLNQCVELIRGDELGTLASSFNEMAKNIRELILQVKNAGDRVFDTSQNLSLICSQTADASQEVAREITKIADNAETQKRSAEDSARAMNEMAQGVQQIAEASEEVTNLAMAANQEARGGNEAVQNAIRQIESVKDTVETSASIIRKLEQRSDEIGSIVEVITDIAAQTNLLALNASIEAARAGEHGRGFAVVAGEVRKLSQRSSEYAQQINNLIQAIRKDTAQAVEAMNRGTREVQEGVAVALQAGEAFERISRSIDNVFAKIENVTSVVEELSAGTEEVAASADESARIAKEMSGNTQSVVAVTEEQLAAVSEISESAEGLRRMAQDLQETIARFEV